MVVVLAIIVTITSIALLGQTSFNRSMVLTDIAYTLAFSIREAQSLGLSSRVFGGTQNTGYGVHFVRGVTNSYTLFADISPAASGNVQSASVCPGHSVGSGPEARPGDCIYNGASENVRSYALNRGFTILSFCGTQTSNGSMRCSNSASSLMLDSLSIVYLRPNTQSVVTGVRSGTRIPLSDATIRVASPDGAAERCVYVSKAGQVAVFQKGETSCP